MTYFHPRDIFDDQPIPGLSRLRRFKATVGLARTFAKLEHLFDMATFGTVSDYVAAQDWSTVRKLKVSELSAN